MVMMAVAFVWFALGLHNRFPAPAAVALCVVVSIAVSLIVHRWFERPVTQWLQSLKRAGAAGGSVLLEGACGAGL